MISALWKLVDKVKDPMRRRASAGGLNELRGVVGAPEADLQTMSPSDKGPLNHPDLGPNDAKANQ